MAGIIVVNPPSLLLRREHHVHVLDVKIPGQLRHVVYSILTGSLRQVAQKVAESYVSCKKNLAGKLRRLKFKIAKIANIANSETISFRSSLAGNASNASKSMHLTTLVTSAFHVTLHQGFLLEKLRAC